MRRMTCAALLTIAAFGVSGCRTAEQRAAQATEQRQRDVQEAIRVCQGLGHSTEQALYNCGLSYLQSLDGERRRQSERAAAFADALAGGLSGVGAAYTNASRAPIITPPAPVRCNSVYVGNGATRTVCY